MLNETLSVIFKHRDKRAFLSQCVVVAFSEQVNLKVLLLPKTDLHDVCARKPMCVYKGVGLPLIGIVEQKCKFLFVTTHSL